MAGGSSAHTGRTLEILGAGAKCSQDNGLEDGRKHDEVSKDCIVEGLSHPAEKCVSFYRKKGWG